MIWHKFPIFFIFSKKCILRVKDLVAQLRDKLFEQAATIDAFLCLPMLVYELNLEWPF